MQAMKSRVFKNLSGIFIFLTIIASVVLVMRPFYRKVDEAIGIMEAKVLSAIEEKTGIIVSYESLSPTILSRLSIKGIVLKYADSQEEILTVRKTYVSYRLLSILKGDFEHALTKLSVRDVDFNFDDGKLERLFGKEKKEKNRNDFPIASVENLVRTVVFLLPFDVQIRNVKFNYASGKEKYSFAVREWTVFKNSQDSSVYVSLLGTVDSNLKAFGYKSAGFAYRIDGNIIDSISGTSFRVRFDDYRKAAYSLNHMEFLLNYDSHNFVLRSAGQYYPLNMRVLFNLDDVIVDSDVKMTELDPLALFRVPKYNGAIKFFRGTKFSTDSNFFMNLKTHEYSWTTDSAVYMPKRRPFTKQGQNVYAKCSGNNTNIIIDDFSADGGVFKGRFRGEFYIPKLQPKGTLVLDYYAYRNGNRLSTTISFFPRKTEGFDFYMPEVKFGKWCTYSNFKCYSSLGKNIVLVVEADDLSHPEYGESGKIIANGTMSLGENIYLQASGNFNKFFLDTALKTAAFFTDDWEGKKPYVGPVVPASAKYITQCEVYFATDFRNFTYNCPVVICANTKSDREILFVSFDGNNTSFSFSRIDLMYGTNSLLASGSLDIDVGGRQLSFLSDVNVNSLPYRFNGLYSFGEWLSVTGDYGTEASIYFGKNTDGTIHLDDMPVAYRNYMAAISLDSNFRIEGGGSWNALVDRFELSELSDNFRSRPRIVLSGDMDDHGFIASNISYSDNSSSLDGTGYLLWNRDAGYFDNAVVSVNLSNSVSSESISFSGEAKNLAMEKFSFKNFKRELYFNIQSRISSFPVSRFLLGQGTGNTVSIDLNASGTVENPLYSLKVTDSSVLLGGSNLNAKLTATYIDNVFDVSDVDISWKYFKIDEVFAHVDMNTFNGDAVLHAKMNGVDRKLDAALDFSMSNLSDPNARGLPEAFSIEADCSSLESNFIENFKPFHVSLIRSPGRFDIVTDENIGAYGEILDDGFVAFSIADDKAFHFTMDGTMQNQIIDLNLNGLYWDLSKIAYIFNSEIFTLHTGVLSGNLNVSGAITDPEINGRLSLLNPDVNFPQFIPYHFATDEIQVVFEQEEISFTETLFNVGSGHVAAGGIITLDRWSFGNLSFNIRTLENTQIPIDAYVSKYGMKGFATVDANIAIEDRNISMTGSIGLSNSVLSVSLSGPIKKNPAEKKSRKSRSNEQEKSGFIPTFDYNVNLAIMVGQRVQVDVNPFLRSLIAPSTPLAISIDSAAGLWNLKGDVVLRGGEISYLNRNFYLKQGRLILNETQDHFDPNITVRAETRERDSDGEIITISLSAISQNISTFNAVLSSVPYKSEKELMELLGQIVVGDSTSVGNFLVAGVDYGVQVTVLRKLENALRDLCNFDIFSVRTTALQNTIMQGLDMGNRRENSSVIGNLFDNSTVYIGKYFGKDVYADALLHWSYDKRDGSSGEAMGKGLVFHPEIGLEFNAPFANIRWNFAPDLSDFQESWAKATSVTLSWRFAF